MNSSTALPESQAMLHCIAKALLYNIEMTFGNRLKLARERLVPRPTQKEIGKAFGISDKAVSAWERDETAPEPEKIPELRRLLKVPYFWLMEGTGDPPPPDTAEVSLESLSPTERAAVDALIEMLHKRGGKAA